MEFKEKFLGFDKNQVNEVISSFQQIIKTQKKDIEYLFQKNQELNNSLEKFKKRKSQNCNQFNDKDVFEKE